MTELVRRIAAPITASMPSLSEVSFSDLLSKFTTTFQQKKAPERDLLKIAAQPYELKESLAAYEPKPGMVSAAFVTACQLGNVESARILLKAGANIMFGKGAAIRYGMRHYDIVSELLKHSFHKSHDCSRYMTSGDMSFAARSLLLSRGVLPPKHQEAVKEGQLNIPERIVELARTDDLKDYINEIFGSPKKKTLKSDAFPKNAEWHDCYFVRSAILTGYTADSLGMGNGILEPDRERTFPERVFRELIQNDIKKVEETKGLSWKKYSESLESGLGGVSHFRDVAREIAQAVILPVLISFVDEDTNSISKERLTLLEAEAFQIALRFALHDKTALDIPTLSRKWHKPGNQVADHLRPYKSVGEWLPLFDEDIDLGNGLSIVCRTTPQQLEREGAILHHCVGYGSYAKMCQDAGGHILSIVEDDIPIATIQLSNLRGDLFVGARDKLTGEVQTPDGTEWKLMQFYGYNNTQPSDEAKNAWDRFLELIEEKEVHLNSRFGPKKIKGVKNYHPVERTIGYPIEKRAEIIPQILTHYKERVKIEKKRGEDVSLVTMTTFEELEAFVAENKRE